MGQWLATRPRGQYQLTYLGSLSRGKWPRLVTPGADLVGGLGAGGYMIFRTSRLLTAEWITLAKLELDGFKRQPVIPAAAATNGAVSPLTVSMKSSGLPG